jgi:hypothetical protein
MQRAGRLVGQRAQGAAPPVQHPDLPRELAFVVLQQRRCGHEERALAAAHRLDVELKSGRRAVRSQQERRTP